MRTNDWDFTRPFQCFQTKYVLGLTVRWSFSTCPLLFWFLAECRRFRMWLQYLWNLSLGQSLILKCNFSLFFGQTDLSWHAKKHLLFITATRTQLNQGFVSHLQSKANSVAPPFLNWVWRASHAAHTVKPLQADVWYWDTFMAAK